MLKYDLPGHQMAPLMMCWYNPLPAPKSGQHLATAQRLKTGSVEAPVFVERSHENQTQLDGTDAMTGDNKTEKELVDDGFVIVKTEHLHVEDISAELCTHIIYNYGVLRENFSIGIKSGDNYLDENSAEGMFLQCVCKES